MAPSAASHLRPADRPTPTVSIRLHETTLVLLDTLRADGETWERFLVRTILLPRNMHPPMEPRPPRRSTRKVSIGYQRQGHVAAAGLATQERFLQVGLGSSEGAQNG